MSTAKVNTLQDAAGGNSMLVADINRGRFKRSFNLNGTGTIAARWSFGIASYTDNGVGDYTATFSAAMADADYGMAFAHWPRNSSGTYDGPDANTPTTAAARITTQYRSAADNSGDVTVLTAGFHGN